MCALISGYTMALLLLLESGYLMPVVEYDKGLRYEEYVVEHEISTGQARNSALSSDIESVMAPPGCQGCTLEDKKYCLGTNFIADHCCCDKRYNEYLPYIPHTCYLGDQLCTPTVQDCAEYGRLRTCCCDKYVLEKWKEKFMRSGVTSTSRKPLMLVFLAEIVYIFVHYIIM